MAKSKVQWKGGRRRRSTRTTVEVFKALVRKKGLKPGQWYFRLKAANGEIIAQSEGYTRRYTATQGAMRVLAAK